MRPFPPPVLSPHPFNLLLLLHPTVFLPPFTVSELDFQSGTSFEGKGGPPAKKKTHHTEKKIHHPKSERHPLVPRCAFNTQTKLRRELVKAVIEENYHSSL